MYLLAKSDARRIPLPDGSVHCCVTSPPYFGLRDYGIDGQIGLEATPDEFVETMVAVFREVRRVLRDDGTCWLNLGDSYNAYNGNRGGSTSFSAATDDARPSLPSGHGLTAKNLKPKDLIGIPWRTAIALQDDGWWLRSDIIWEKPNQMTESVTDRPTKSHEYIFLLAKRERYYFDAHSVRENAAGKTRHDLTGGKYNPPGQSSHTGTRSSVGRHNDGLRNIRTVWTTPTQPYAGAHFAAFPPKLVEPCIKAGCPVGGLVLDPFNGSGTAGVVATCLGRRYVGFDINPEYLSMARQRIERPHAPARKVDKPCPLFDLLDSQPCQ